MVDLGCHGGGDVADFEFFEAVFILKLGQGV